MELRNALASTNGDPLNGGITVSFCFMGGSVINDKFHRYSHSQDHDRGRERERV